MMSSVMKSMSGSNSTIGLRCRSPHATPGLGKSRGFFVWNANSLSRATYEGYIVPTLKLHTNLFLFRLPIHHFPQLLSGGDILPSTGRLLLCLRCGLGRGRGGSSSNGSHQPQPSGHDSFIIHLLIKGERFSSHEIHNNHLEITTYRNSRFHPSDDPGELSDLTSFELNLS